MSFKISFEVLDIAPSIGLYTKSGRIDGFNSYNSKKFCRIGEHKIELCEVEIINMFLTKDNEKYLVGLTLSDLVYSRGENGLINEDEFILTEGFQIAVSPFDKTPKKKSKPLW